jgi:IstB-like ATP binding protein
MGSQTLARYDRPTPALGSYDVCSPATTPRTATPRPRDVGRVAAPAEGRGQPMTEPAAEAAIWVACRELHLPTIAAEATRIADDAARERLTHRAFLAEVLAAEVDERANRRRARRLHEARFPPHQAAGWTSTAPWPPAFPRPPSRRYRPARSVDAGHPVVLLGDSGTGKSHLLIGLGWPPAKAAAGSVTPPPPRWPASWSSPPANASCHAPCPLRPLRPALSGRARLPAPRQRRR